MPAEMKSFHEYESIAKKIISNYRHKVGFVEMSDELLGKVIRNIAVADWKYDSSHKLTPYQFRQMRGIYAIREYVKNKQNRLREIEDMAAVYYLPDNERANKRVNFLLKHTDLSGNERQVIDNVLLGRSFYDIAASMGITYQQCTDLYGRSIRKLKRMAGIK